MCKQYTIAGISSQLSVFLLWLLTYEVCVLQGDSHGMDEHDLLEHQQRVRTAIFMFSYLLRL